MKSSGSLVVRSLLAFALMAGFYVFAVGISVALLWFPYVAWGYLGPLRMKLAAVCLGAAGTVLWAIVPRPDKFAPPGPQLTASTAPALFEIINDVAGEASQAPPQDVYLLNEVNAWVAHRGGVMGIGSRRVMGVGLPLIEGLSPLELRAVIAHEFGHYCAGDVALGPWIYKTRGAIGRALAGVHDTFLEGPFSWYGRLFMRMTMLVSRRQEFVADQTAARIGGAASMMSALNKVSFLTPAYTAYLSNEIGPVLRAGFLPPVAEGFKLFVDNPQTRQAFANTASKHTLGSDTGKFDSHPPLSDRLSALARLQSNRDAALIEPAVIVPFDSQAYARELLEHHLGKDRVARLRHIEWDDVGQAVYAAHWQGLASEHASWFGSYVTEGIPNGKPRYIAMGSELVGSEEININSEERIDRAVQLMTAGLGAALVRSGWKVSTAPGCALEVVKGELRLDPRAVIVGLAKGDLSADSWRAHCQSLEITGIRLRP